MSSGDPHSPIDNGSPSSLSPPKPPKQNIVSSGRGGSGNIRHKSELKVDMFNEAEILQKSRAEAALNPRVKIKYTGRGGSGNIRAASVAQSIPFDSSLDPDDEYEQIVLHGAQLAKRDKTPSTGRGGLGNSARPRSKSFVATSAGSKAKKDKSRRRRSLASLRFTTTSISTEHFELQSISSEASSLSLSLPASRGSMASASSGNQLPTPPSSSASPSSIRDRAGSTSSLSVLTSASVPRSPVLRPPPSPSASAPSLRFAVAPMSPRLEQRIAECRRELAAPDLEVVESIKRPVSTSVGSPQKLQKTQNRSSPKWWQRSSQRQPKENRVRLQDMNPDEHVEAIMEHLEEVGKHAMEVRLRMREGLLARDRQRYVPSPPIQSKKDPGRVVDDGQKNVEDEEAPRLSMEARTSHDGATPLSPVEEEDVEFVSFLEL